MRVTVLGRSGTFPAPGGACSSYLLRTTQSVLLLDCGSGALSRLQQHLQVEELSAIVLSHLHYDHCSDIFSLKYMLETRHALGETLPRIPLFLPEEPASIAEEIASGNLFDVTHIHDGLTLNFRDLALRFDWMPHLIPSYAITAHASGEKFVYSGDTGMNERLVEVARHADLFLCESTFASDGDALASTHHLSAENAGRIARDAKVGALLLTHLWYRENESRYRHFAHEYFAAAEVAVEGETYWVGGGL